MEFYDVAFSVFATDSHALLIELGLSKMDLMILDNIKVAENEAELSLCRFVKSINGLYVSIVKTFNDGIVYNVQIVSTNENNFESSAIEQLLIHGVINLKFYSCR